MIPVPPKYLILLSWVVGTSPVLFLPTLALIGAIGALVFFLRRSFGQRSLALLGIFGLMLVDTLVFIAFTIHFMLAGEPGHFFENRTFDIFHDVNFALSLLGVIGAGFAAIMIGFGRSRISLSKVFPHVSFLEAPADLKQKVALLSEKAGISAPGICLIDSGSPSAFTVRANRRYSIAVSVGLLESLEESEIEACLAHEVAHLKNNDFEMRFLATIAKVALFARPLSHFLEPAVYRSREFLADSTAAGLVGGPNALISAISKLKESTDLEPALPNSTCVCNLYSRRRLILRLFDKHPSLEDRLRVLQEMR